MARTTTAPAPQRIRREHGRYTLVAGKLGGTYAARAFLTGAKPGSAIIDETTGADPEAAIEALIEHLGETDAQSVSDRRGVAGSATAVATPREFAQALAAVPVTDKQRAMLRAHAAAGEAGLRAPDLADAAGYAGGDTAMLQYGKLGRLIAEHLGIEMPPPAGKGDRAGAALMAAGAEQDDGTWLWVMHPELSEALGTA